MLICGLSLNSTSISSSTLLNYFSVTQCKIGFFYLGISPDFCRFFFSSKSYLISPVSYSRPININSYFCPFILHLLCCTFPIVQIYCFEFSPLTTSFVFHAYVFFFFTSFTFCLYLHTMLNKAERNNQYLLLRIALVFLFEEAL